MKINADLKKEEMRINAENNAKVLPLSHDFVYNSINFFSWSQNSIMWTVFLSPLLDILEHTSLGSASSPHAQSQMSSSSMSSPYSSSSSSYQGIHGFEMKSYHATKVSCYTSKESRTGVMAKKKDSWIILRDRNILQYLLVMIQNCPMKCHYLHHSPMKCHSILPHEMPLYSPLKKAFQ